MILEAYNLPKYQLAEGPSWLDSDWFNLEAKSGDPASESQLRLMLQTLLSDRFKLDVHHESKEMRAYVLEVSKNGTKLQPMKEGDPIPQISNRPHMSGQIEGAMSDIGTIQHFISEMSSRVAAIDRPVLDNTGLKGLYYFSLVWDENFMDDVDTQMGLKFVSQRAPVDVLVIEHVEKPSAN